MGSMSVQTFIISFVILLLWRSVALCAPEAELRFPQAEYALQIDVNEQDLSLESDPRVVLQIRSPLVRKGACVYVPALDPLLEKVQHKQMMRGPVPQDKLQRKGLGFVWARPQQWEELQAGVFRLHEQADGEVSTAFSAGLLGWKDRKDGVRILSEFYPRLLSRCPGVGETPLQAMREDADYVVFIQKPESWSVLGAGYEEKAVYRWKGPAFHLVFYQRGEVVRLETGGLRLHVLSDSENFREQAPLALAAVDFYRRKLGSPAARDLLLVETDDHEPLQSPGLMTLNRPQQPLLRKLQEKWLRWNAWQMSQALATQWFGQTIRSREADQLWLTQGFVVTLAGMFLEAYPPQNELFLDDEILGDIFKLSYNETQDLTAALGRVFYPQRPLVGEDRPRDLEASVPLEYMKHALAIRYLAWWMGEQDFAKWLADISQMFRYQALTPQSLLASLPPKAAFDLKRFWESAEWPDFQIEDWTSEGSSTRLSWKQNPDMPVAFDLEVELKSGDFWRTRIDSRTDGGVIEIPYPRSDIQRMTLNPGREIFDTDRFNNRSDRAVPKLFPGNAKNLADDAYTLLWFPGLSKLPGEGFSLQLYWQAYRYVGSDLSGRLIYRTADGSRGYRLLYQQRLPEQALGLYLSIYEGDGLAIEGERLGDLTLSKRELFGHGSTWTAELGFRLRQELGDNKGTHTTHKFRLVSKFELSEPCGGQVEGQFEKTGFVPSEKFSYDRNYSITQWGCSAPRFQGKIRTFVGQLTSRGSPPKGAYFSAQQLEEARVRLDRPTLEPSSRIWSFGLDLAMTTPLPLPSSLFALPRRSVVKSYSDIAWEPELNRLTRVAGLGLGVPFGGDVTGRESITALQLSLYGVFYRKIDERSDHRPGLLFDFSGQL